jgi:hypothetical protein
MEPRLTVYIDEGGDNGVKDGLWYHGTRHEWFTVAAYVIRTDRSADLVRLRDELLSGANARQASSLHYYKLREDRRQQVCELLATQSARAFGFASHKSNMREYVSPKLGTIKAREFYHWCCRLLLERVMEFAAIDAKSKGYAPAPLELIFSENAGLKYDVMFSYFETITQQARLGQFKLKPKYWVPEMMVRDHWKAEPHARLAGLQLADIVASAFQQGANSAASNFNVRPAIALSPIMARDARNHHRNAGVTLWPLKKQAPIPIEARPLFEHYGYAW